MKNVLVISSRDISNPNVLSGTSYSIVENLRKIFNVDILDNLCPKSKHFEYKYIDFYWRFFLAKIVAYFWKVFNKPYNWEGSPLIVKFYTKKINLFLKKNNYDYLFSDKGSLVIGLLESNIPIIYMSDATCSLMVNYYPGFTNLPKHHEKFLNFLEKSSIEKAYKCIYRSQWAATSAINDYGKNISDVHVFPLGPNIPDKFLISDIDACIQKKHKNDTLEFLLIGSDWERKGCQQALDVVHILNKKGIQSKLTICGVKMPPNLDKPDFLTVIPYIQKSTKQGIGDLISLYKKTNYFLFPVKAECLGISIIEAMSFGCPIITSPTGGVPELVTPKNGCVSTKTSEYVDYIIRNHENKTLYEEACYFSYEVFLKKCSWDSWRKNMLKVIKA